MVRRLPSTTTRWGLATLAAIASVVVVAPGCSEDAPKPSSPEPVVIGVALGLTGNFKDFAAPLRNAVSVAEGEINASGGLLGRPLRFLVLDDQSSEREDIDAIAQRFVDEKVAAVVGPLGSSQVARTQAVLGPAQILQIVPAATSTELSTVQPRDDRYLFRTTPADDFQGAAVMLLAERTPAGVAGGTTDGGVAATCQRLAIVNIDNAYGNPMAQLIADFWPKRAGRQIAIREVIPKDLLPDYKAVVAKVVATNPQCLALISYDDVAAQFFRDFRESPQFATLSSSGFFFIGTDGIYTKGLLLNGAENQSDPTSTNSAEGVFGTNPDTQPGSREYNELRTLYASYFAIAANADVESFVANTFDAAVLAALAVQQAGSATDRVRIRDAMLEIARPPGRVFTPAQIGDALQAIRRGEDVDYKGASGNVDFDGAGNVTAGFIVWKAARKADKTLDFETVGRLSAEELSERIR